jgi:hypothetical protein
MQNVVYSGVFFAVVSAVMLTLIMLSIICTGSPYAEYHLCLVSLMLSIAYAEYHLC